MEKTRQTTYEKESKNKMNKKRKFGNIKVIIFVDK